MKIFIAFILSFSLVTQWYAGLFEYTQWERTRINTTSYESADVIESITLPRSNNPYSLWNQYDYSRSQARYSPPVQPTIFANDYYDSRNTSNSYYDTSSIFSEMQYYISLANGIRNDISKIRKYGSEYIALRNQLKRDLSDLENQINYLSNLRKNLAQNSRYYSNQSVYRSPTRSQRLADYYRKYGYEYRDSSYYYYDESYDYYQRKPEWLNENLRPRDEGYIYIQ